jgi:phage minor structural protein
MILYFADRSMNILGQASTQLPEGFVISKDLKAEDVDTGVATFECDISFKRKNRAQLEAMAEVGNYLLRHSNDENEFFTIIDAEIDTKKQVAYIYAEDAGLDLLNEIAGKFEATEAHTIDWYINKYAKDSGFVIGLNECPSTTTRTLSWDGEDTVTKRIASIATQFGGYEISYTFEVDGLYVTQKYINIHEKRGKDTGEQLRLNRDIDRIITKKSVANLATAFSCTGGTPEGSETPITLKGYTHDDGDFYVGTDGILRSRKAAAKWSRYVWNKEPNQLTGYEGHIIRPYSYDTTSQKTLCSHAITELKKVCDMEVNYEVDIKKLPPNVKIGDRINIVDDEGGLYLSTRLLKLETSIADKEQKATLGENLLKGSGISQKVADLAAQFAANAQSAQKALEVATNAKANADAALEEANTAAETVQGAIDAATSATQAANAATESAGKATEAATKATEAVDKVEESVSGLQQTIDNANQAAENAHAAAQTATQKAEEAKNAAANAQTKAEEAATANSQAQAKAEEAVAKANTATDTANTAKEQAETASATAAAAKADAEQAEKDIAAWESNLETFKSTMTADYARKTDLTEATASLQSQITQNAGQITSTVQSVQRIDETVNNAKTQAEEAKQTAAQAQSQVNAAKAEAEAAQSAADAATAAAAAAQGEADAAKSAAETAQSVASKAEADLAAAQADLATVTGRVGATEEEIAAAQAKVDEAKAAAEKAKTDAAAAANTASSAQTKANEAATAAANAQAKADKAATDAEAAKGLANEAKGSAAAAQEAANAAANTAATAQETANTAKANAANAQAKADKAATDAAAAQTAADTAATVSAQAQADLAAAQKNLSDVTSRVGATEEEVAAAQAAVATAQAAADKAKQDAATAQSTANTAKTNAANAQTAANNAKAAADAAQEAATAAQAAADKAQEDVDALAERVTSAETSIEQNSTQIALRATKEEVTTTLGGYYTKEEADSSLSITAGNILSSISETYVENSELGSYKEEVSTRFSQSTEGFNMQIQAVNETVTGVNEDLQTKFEKVSKYFSFNENGISIGGGENAMSLILDNDNGVVFAQNGFPFGWWDGVDFHSGNIVVSVNERAQFGNFAFIPRSSGSLSFLKVDAIDSSHTHSYKEVVTQAATCYSTGIKANICKCGHIETSVIAALSHEYETVITPCTETQVGKITYTCKHCGDRFVDDLEIIEGEEKVLPLVQKEYVRMKFVPKYTGTYYFQSLDNVSADPDGYLYTSLTGESNSDRVPITGADDNQGNSGAISFHCVCTAGTVYYFAVRLWNGSGEVTVKVTYNG